MKALFNHMTSTWIGFMSQLGLMLLTCNLFYGMDLLTAVLFIQFCTGMYTIFVLVDKLKKKFHKYLDEYKG